MVSGLVYRSDEADIFPLFDPIAIQLFFLPTLSFTNIAWLSNFVSFETIIVILIAISANLPQPALPDFHPQVPHKTARGAAALKRLELYEGVPPAQDHVKKMVVPAALRVLRLKPGRKFCTLKRVSAEVGWGYKDVVDRLEEKRKVKGQAYFERKVSVVALSDSVRV